MLAARRLSVMLSMSARCLQGTYISAGETLEHEFPAARADRGGADAAHRRPPPQLRHRPQRGEPGRPRPLPGHPRPLAGFSGKTFVLFPPTLARAGTARNIPCSTSCDHGLALYCKALSLNTHANIFSQNKPTYCEKLALKISLIRLK